MVDGIKENVPKELTQRRLSKHLVIDQKLYLPLPGVIVKPFHAIVQVCAVSSEGGEDHLWIRRQWIWFPVHPAGVNQIAAGLGLQGECPRDLLREGASMTDIGQVLRHKHLESTAIYAKVDLQRLRLAASPWPGAIR